MKKAIRTSERQSSVYLNEPFSFETAFKSFRHATPHRFADNPNGILEEAVTSCHFKKLLLDTGVKKRE